MPNQQQSNFHSNIWTSHLPGSPLGPLGPVSPKSPLSPLGPMKEVFPSGERIGGKRNKSEMKMRKKMIDELYPKNETLTWR